MRKRRHIDEADGGRDGHSGRRAGRRGSSDLDEGFVDPVGSARSYRDVQASGALYRTHASSYRGAAQAREASYAPVRGDGAAGSTHSGYEDYRARQVQMHARDSGRYHARRSGLDASSEKVARTPGLAIALGAACVVLLLVFVVRAPALIGALSKANETTGALSAQQTQLDELKSTNKQLQQSIDSMQATIDTYNAKK